MSTLPAIVLFQPSTRPWNTPNLSPFCVKLETYLRMAEIPHEVKSGPVTSAPKGKIPWVSLDGVLLGDSQLILERLESLRAEPLDAWLSPQQKALGHVTRRALEEAFYFIVMYLRWATDATPVHQRPEFVKVLPKPLRWLFPLIARDVRKILRTQGTARHAPEEVNQFGNADLDALATLLGNNTYFLGDRISTFDATVYAFLVSVMNFPGDSPVKQRALAHANLVAYRDRMHARYFPELA